MFQLQDKVTSEQFVTRKKSYEIQRLRQRLDHAGKEIDSLRFENRKHSVKNRAFDIEVSWEFMMGLRMVLLWGIDQNSGSLLINHILFGSCTYFLSLFLFG